jgi:hypothetical protein
LNDSSSFPVVPLINSGKCGEEELLSHGRVLEPIFSILYFLIIFGQSIDHFIYRYSSGLDNERLPVATRGTLWQQGLSSWTWRSPDWWWLRGNPADRFNKTYKPVITIIAEWGSMFCDFLQFLHNYVENFRKLFLQVNVSYDFYFESNNAFQNCRSKNTDLGCEIRKTIL